MDDVNKCIKRIRERKRNGKEREAAVLIICFSILD